MDTTELCDRVVAVLVENALVELVGAVHAHGGVDGGVATQVQIAHEFVEEQSTQALGGSRVSRE
jgi:hypothetical protein